MVLEIHPGPSNELSKCRNWKQRVKCTHVRAHLQRQVIVVSQRQSRQNQLSYLKISIWSYRCHGTYSSTSTFVGQQMPVAGIFEKDKVRLFAIDQFVASYASEACIGQISCSFPVLRCATLKHIMCVERSHFVCMCYRWNSIRKQAKILVILQFQALPHFVSIFFRKKKENCNSIL